MHTGFLRTPFHHFLFPYFGVLARDEMSVHDKLICVHLVMPCCMFSMQLFLSEIVKFRFIRK